MATKPRTSKPPAPSDPFGAGADLAELSGVDEAGDPIDPGFDEATYLRAFPDIAEAVRRGTLASGLAHFHLSGRAEGRLEKPEYRSLREIHAMPVAPQVSVDALTISRSGATLMIGWSDDRLDRLTGISLETRSDTRHNWTAFPRLVRADVDRTLDAASGHRFGFLLVAAPQAAAGDGGVPLVGPPIDPGTANAPVFGFASGTETMVRQDPVVASDADLRDLALAALPTAAAGEQDPEVMYGILDLHVGVQIATINRVIIETARARRFVERFGPAHGRYRGSVITTLRGGVDQIVPRLAVTASGPGSEAYEFILVITDPELYEAAARAAHIAKTTLGVSLTLVVQRGGDPAGMGEDAASDLARSDRLIFMDQTVFPRDPDWALRHSALLDEAPELQTRLMGALLYHADGSLAHGGFYFDQEPLLSWRADGMPQCTTQIRWNRLTHPAPAAGLPRQARQATAIPGAFLSINRGWFEQLGGFTRHYYRAALEDIDLCLRSLKQGVPPWVQPLPMWYFERRGQPRPEPSRGGVILNDWLFHRQWDALISALPPQTLA